MGRNHLDFVWSPQLVSDLFFVDNPLGVMDRPQTISVAPQGSGEQGILPAAAPVAAGGGGGDWTAAPEAATPAPGGWEPAGAPTAGGGWNEPLAYAPDASEATVWEQS